MVRAQLVLWIDRWSILTAVKVIKVNFNKIWKQIMWNFYYQHFKRTNSYTPRHRPHIYEKYLDRTTQIYAPSAVESRKVILFVPHSYFILPTTICDISILNVFMPLVYIVSTYLLQFSHMFTCNGRSACFCSLWFFMLILSIVISEVLYMYKLIVMNITTFLWFHDFSCLNLTVISWAWLNIRCHVKLSLQTIVTLSSIYTTIIKKRTFNLSDRCWHLSFNKE